MASVASSLPPKKRIAKGRHQEGAWVVTTYFSPDDEGQSWMFGSLDAAMRYETDILELYRGNIPRKNKKKGTYHSYPKTATRSHKHWCYVNGWM